ncbi:MAG TPA: hypothetical protein VKR52_11895 [Terracidiphilus sp.]|nr:hypothetical protein [Terracidiphilus sp.]
MLESSALTADRPILLFEAQARLKELSTFNKAHPHSTLWTDEELAEQRRLQMAWAVATDALFQFENPILSPNYTESVHAMSQP